MQDLNEAIRLDPTMFCLFNRGNVYLKLGNLAAATADFTKAGHLKPTFAAAFNVRGVGRYRSGFLSGFRQGLCTGCKQEE